MSMNFVFDWISFLRKILTRIFVEERWLLLFYTIVQFLPIFRRHPLTPNEWIWQALALSFAFSFLICLCGSYLKNISYVSYIIWHFFFHVVIYVSSFIDIFLFSTFRMLLNNTAIQLAFQTNTSETREFFATYCFNIYVFLYLFLFVILAIAEFLSIRYLNKWNPLKLKVIRYILVVYLSLGFVNLGTCTHIFMAPNVEEASLRLINDMPCVQQHQFMTLGVGLWVAFNANENAKELKNNIHDTRLNKLSNYNGTIILVIGESHIKKHSSIYGYSLQTNPCLTSYKDSLCIFSNVITPINRTCEALKCILSVASLDGNVNFDHSPLFPAVFNDSGWNTVFCSNQINHLPGEEYWDASLTSFLNEPTISKACFSTRNKCVFEYDDIMVDSLLANKSQYHIGDKPTLLIVHLMGQHVSYKKRYPAEYNHFSINDYQNRSDLTDIEKQMIAHYDNATLFNDTQIHKIIQSYKDEDAIIVYLSDHGEEVFDYRKYSGRTYNLSELAPDSYHYQIEIPFFIFMSEKYKNNHLEKSEQIKKSIDRPFMTDDLSHLLFYLGEIDTEWYDSTRCLIHPNFNENRPRILYNGDNYDILSEAL